MCQIFLIFFLLTFHISSIDPVDEKPSLHPVLQIVKWTSGKFRCNQTALKDDPRIRKIKVDAIQEALLNIKEACRRFKTSYYNIGTDEVNITSQDFIPEMMTIVCDHCKEVTGWLPGASMDQNAIRQFWAEVSIPRNSSVIDSRYRYLNHTDYYSDLSAIYNSRLCDSPCGSDLATGGIYCIWNYRKPVSPPVWESPKMKPDHEAPYSNENLWSSPPAGLRLQKGWNNLVIKLPVGRFSTPEARLVKWIFTAMTVTPDGKKQPEEIIYSPEKMLPGKLHSDKGGTRILSDTVYESIPGKHCGLRLPKAWSDNMVLQRDRIIKLYGSSGSNEPVKVSIAGRSYFARASSTGKWNVILDPLKSGGPYELKVMTYHDTIIVQNIVAGEVWFCSGQSNMEWPVNRSDGWDMVCESSPDDDLRLINFKRRPVDWDQPWDSITLNEVNNLDFFDEGNWSVATPESLGEFSAVAYYFGRELREELRVPIGLIEMAVGGSPAEAWIERKAFELHPQLIDLLYDYRKSEFQESWVRDVITKTLKQTDNPRQRHPFEPAYLYEAGIYHLAGFPVRGFIWYQGESNASFPGLYEVMLPVLVQNWRESWGDSTLPFYFAQLSGLNRPSWPDFREIQRKLASKIPHSGMVVTIDVGHPTDVHPRDKKSVGERFASLALRDTYGRSRFPVSPEPHKAFRRGKRIIITFKYAGKLKTSDGLAVRELEVSETGNLFKPSTANLCRNRIIIKSPEAKYIRYGWKPYSDGNLTGETGLPVPTFRFKTN